jgi:hypothetical protein
MSRRLEDIDLSTILDLPEELMIAIANARLELSTIEAERANIVIERETERATTNRRIRGLEEALGALSTRPDETLSSIELPPPLGTYNDLVGSYLSADRTDLELEHSIMQVVSKDERVRLSASDKSKLYSTFIKGSITKFKASSTIVGLEEISTIKNTFLVLATSPRTPEAHHEYLRSSRLPCSQIRRGRNSH